MKIVLIGAGNVASQLGRALAKKGHRIIMVYSRTEVSARTLAKKINSPFTVNISDIPEDADIYFLALPDKLIPTFRLPFSPKCIVHTSGSAGLNAFPVKTKNTGVIYPLQTFSKDRMVDFKNIPLCIEASNAAVLKTILKVVRTLSTNIVRLNSSKRRKLHLAAVFANNFTNYLYSVSDDLLKKEKLSFKLLLPLILETAMKVTDNSPEKMQTGPARRGDTETIKNHRKLLAGNKNAKIIYNLLSKNIENKFKTSR